MPTKKSAQLAPIGSNTEYDTFLQELKPLGLALVTSSCKVDRRAYFQLVDSKKAVRSISARYRLDSVRDDSFDAGAIFKLTVSDKKNITTPLVIECAFTSHVHAKPPVSKTLAERFARSDFRVVIWPYFRQFVSDITARMAVRPIMVPISVKK